MADVCPSIDGLWWVAGHSPNGEQKVMLDPFFAGDGDAAAAAYLLELFRGSPGHVHDLSKIAEDEKLDTQSIVCTLEAVEQYAQSCMLSERPAPSSSDGELMQVAAQVAAAVASNSKAANTSRLDSKSSDWDLAIGEAESWKRQQLGLLRASGPAAADRLSELAALDSFVLAAALLYIQEQNALPVKELASEGSAAACPESNADGSGGTGGVPTGHVQEDSGDGCLLWWVDHAQHEDVAVARAVDQDGPVMEMGDPAAQAMLQLIQGAGEQELDSNKRDALATLDEQTILCVLEAVEHHMRSTFSSSGSSSVPDGAHPGTALTPKVLDHVVRKVSAEVDSVQDLGMPGFSAYPCYNDGGGQSDETLNAPSPEVSRWEESVNEAYDWFSGAARVAPLLLAATKTVPEKTKQDALSSLAARNPVQIAAALNFAHTGGEARAEARENSRDDAAQHDAAAMELLARERVWLH